MKKVYYVENNGILWGGIETMPQLRESLEKFSNVKWEWLTSPYWRWIEEIRGGEYIAAACNRGMLIPHTAVIYREVID